MTSCSHDRQQLRRGQPALSANEARQQPELGGKRDEFVEHVSEPYKIWQLARGRRIDG